MMTKFQAAITEQYNGKADMHEAHKLLLENYLRKGGEQLDMPGYKANELYLQTLHALRIFDVASAKELYKKWQHASEERMNAQLFGESKKAVVSLNLVQVRSASGVDIATKTLGDCIKLENKQLEKFIQTAELLVLLSSA